MIELQHDELIFTFPDLRLRLKDRAQAWIDSRLAEATSEQRARLPSSREELYPKFDWCVPKVRVAVSFQRTLRIPDDGKDYPLPPGLGRFPVFHVDDFPDVLESWKKRGGVMMPMHRAEALWLSFSADYPIALKSQPEAFVLSRADVGPRLYKTRRKTTSSCRNSPGSTVFRVSNGIIRQFVAVPLGKGLTVEQQLTGGESWGGLQLQAFPVMIEKCWAERVEKMLKLCWKALTTPPPISPRGAMHLQERRPRIPEFATAPPRPVLAPVVA